MIFPLLPRLAAAAPSSLLLSLHTPLSTSPRTLLALTATTSTLGIGLYTFHTRSSLSSPFTTSAFQNFQPLSNLSRHLRTRTLLSCDASSPLASSSRNWSYSAYENDAKTPITRGGTANNAEVYRQLSWGSVAGLLGGVAVSVFSRPLALLIGLLVFGLQFLEYNGLHIIPYRHMQRYFTSIDLHSAIMENVAFKLSFGATFALAAFAEF